HCFGKSNIHPTIFFQQSDYGFDMEKVRSAPGMRERSPGVWELVVSAGRDVVTGKQRQVTRTFRTNLRDAKKARAELLTEVSKGRHTGTRATVDDLFADWIVELARKGRSPNTIHGYERVYRHDIQPTLGSMPVTKVLTKTLTDLYGEHQRRGLSARSVYQIHACLSSMFTQACRWGWRDSNPAQWAEPPLIPNIAPEVPTPQDIRALIDEAERGKRPEMARAILVAATTGLRRAELCALRRWRDVDLERGLLRVSASIVNLPGQPVGEIPTKNRRVRVLAIDELTAAILRAQMDQVEERAVSAKVDLVDDPYVFTDTLDGSGPWKPDAVSQYFGRMRKRAGLDKVQFHQLRKFMETYGQEMGYSVTQVAMRAGHDPSIAAKHYSGRVSETDRALAEAVASLIAPRDPA
ncbi:MAG: tyrosine-type recombinase/integrase, partial [Aeromicrobium sp.]